MPNPMTPDPTHESTETLELCPALWCAAHEAIAPQGGLDHCFSYQWIDDNGPCRLLPLYIDTAYPERRLS